MAQRFVLLFSSSILLLACGSSPPPTATAEPTVTPDPAPEPAPEPAPSESEACPLFCTRTDGACTRPDVDDVSNASCGVLYRLGGAEREACPDHCCRPVESSGPDADADGLADSDDRCPEEPEDVDGYEDQDGCPDPDNDSDGIADPSDLCCFAAEDADGDQDADGCPDP